MLVNVHNNTSGTVAFTVTRPAGPGLSPNQFTSGPINRTVPAGGNVTVTVTFAPTTAVLAGPKTATVLIDPFGAATPPPAISVTVTGTSTNPLAAEATGESGPPARRA